MAIGRIPEPGTGIPESIIAAKGDILTGTANDTPAVLSVGTNGHTLVADSAEATGLKWQAPAGSSGPTFRAYRATSSQTISLQTFTKVQFNAESWDTDNCFDSTTNYRFTPNKAGYYSLTTRIGFDQSPNNLVIIELHKNGVQIDTLQYGSPVNSTDYNKGNNAIAYANGTTDYFEIFVYLSASTTRKVDFGEAWTVFTGIWIRS
jgi:hypothetical protein